MGKSFSTYLDLLRFSAAVAVVLEHAVLLGLLPPLGVATELSHEAVVIFFVLSGLVIASSSFSRQTTAREYIVARGARVLSVALPAAIACFGVSLLLRTDTPTSSAGGVAVQFMSSTLFLNGVWTNYVDVPFNGPYWSLCNEVWYYVGWGVFRFVKHRRARVLAGALVLVAMGPPFAALFGLWMIGACIAARQDRIAASLRCVRRPALQALCLGSMLGIVLLASSSLQTDVRDVLRSHVHGWWRMRAAEYVVTDYAIGALIAIHLVAAACLFADGRRFAGSAIGRGVRYCAGFTFTLYLFHYPLLLMWRAALGSGAASLSVGLGSVSATLAAVWIVAFATERQLPRWRQAARAIVELVSRGNQVIGTAHSAPAAAALNRG